MDKKHLYITIFLYFIVIHFGIGQNVINVDSSQLLSIGKQVYVLEDKEGKLTLNDIQALDKRGDFKLSRQHILNYGTTKSVIWIKLIIQNPSDEKAILEIANANHHYIWLYKQLNPNQYIVKKYGALLPFHQRDYQNNFFLLDVLPAHTTTPQLFYVCVKSEHTMEIPLKVGTLKAFFENNQEMDVFYGIYFGLMIVMIIYNLFLYFSVRSKAYLYYVGYLFTLLLINSSANVGYGFRLAWPNYPSFNFYFLAQVGISMNFAMLFAADFLEVKKHSLKMYRILIVFMLLWGITIILSFMGIYLYNFIYSQVVAFSFCLYMIIMGFALYKKGVKSARFYLLAWSFFLIGAMCYVLFLNDITPSNFFTRNSVVLGSALEVLFLSFALGDKINMFRDEKDKAQAEALKKAKENEYLIKEQNTLLEQKVLKRTIELQEKQNEILTQNEELYQQQEELKVTNEALDIQKKNLEITYSTLKSTSDRLNESINYAKHMQSIILPNAAIINGFFKDHFVIYQPKDVVSGDFYWFNTIAEDTGIFILADCTGHGVPGAFMAMIGNTLLHNIVVERNITQPASILFHLNQGIIEVLKQEDGKIKDGMDVMVCLVEKQSAQQINKLTFAGAKLNLLYIKNGKIEQLKGDRISIGEKKNREFINQTIILPAESLIYCMTDGLADQNDKLRKRWSTTVICNLLENIWVNDLSEQKKIILKALNTHQGEEKQRDDISLIGIKI